MKRLIALANAALVVLVSTTASAQGADTSSTSDSGRSSDKEGGAVLLGAKVGGIVPFGGLSPFVTVGIEAGYVFPWLDRSFAAALDVDYTAPSQSGSKAHPRLGDAGGSYDWDITEQQLGIMPVVMYRMTFLGKLTPFVGLGPRILLLKSTVSGSASTGGSISETTEQSTKVGLGVPFGLEYELGPGGLLAEFLFQYGGLDHTATGDTNSGALSLSLGYRFLL